MTNIKYNCYELQNVQKLLRKMSINLDTILCNKFRKITQITFELNLIDLYSIRESNFINLCGLGNVHVYT